MERKKRNENTSVSILLQNIPIIIILSPSSTDKNQYGRTRHVNACGKSRYINNERRKRKTRIKKERKGRENIATKKTKKKCYCMSGKEITR